MSVVHVWAGAITESSAWVRGRVTGSAVRLAVDTDPGFSAPTYFGPENVTADGIGSVEATGLIPLTTYHYAFEDDGVLDTAMAGQFQTFPTPGDPYSFTFWFASCAGATNDVSNHAVFDAIREHDPLFGIHTGDIHYRDISDTSQDPFRDGYDDVLAQPRQAALYRAVPLVYVWDDHDYGPNNSDRTAPGHDAACLTYRERVPHYPLPAGAGAAAIYQSFVCGRVRFVVSDIRSERDPISDSDGPGKTMLGTAQYDWLVDELTNATEPLIVWVSTVPWIATPGSGRDDWGGYDTERTALAAAMETAGVTDRLICLSGDMHALAADTGVNNAWGGFPVLQAAALDRSASSKGGPYTHGPITGMNQYGLLTITDPGGNNPINVSFSARQWSS